MSDGAPSRRQIVLSAILFEGGLGLLGLLLGTLLARPPLEQIMFDPADAALGVAASLPLMLALVVVMRYPLGPLKDLRKLVDELLVPMFRSCGVFDLAVIAVMAGIGEELLFRGLVQQAITERFGPLLGLASASILFGLAHPIMRTYAILAGLIGLYLGALLLRTENLLVPIIVHASYDFFALVYLVRWQPPLPPLDQA